ncbi:hypothetical protein ACQRWP_14970 [Micromonospora trifolii]|uniref:hypothetical protein n=1 Tax=Micromonospora trifolii TaxID=2911208 RepID=UPI003D2F4FE7
MSTTGRAVVVAVRCVVAPDVEAPAWAGTPTATQSAASPTDNQGRRKVDLLAVGVSFGTDITLRESTYCSVPLLSCQIRQAATDLDGCGVVSFGGTQD